jgi:hypothetical protein
MWEYFVQKLRGNDRFSRIEKTWNRSQLPEISDKDNLYSSEREVIVRNQMMNGINDMKNAVARHGYLVPY